MTKEIVQTSRQNISKQLQCDRFVTFVWAFFTTNFCKIQKQSV